MRCLVLAFVAWSLAAASPAAETRVLVLQCEEHQDLKGAIPGRLVRELGRQAILLAARDGLGHATRDKTLGEAAPSDPSVRSIDWAPRVRSHWSGTTVLHLQNHRQQTDLEPVLVMHGELDKATLYPILAAAWEEASRGPLLVRLRQGGLDGGAPEANPENRPPPEVEELLGRMNFISQWDAVARAHRAIAARGASAEWLSVLARGYAHLGSLIDHHWTAAPEAFYARGLLYAERTRVVDEDSPEALWLRPYVLAVCGAHSAGLAEAEALEAEPGEPPYWASVIDPVCRFDTDRLTTLIDDEEQSPLLETVHWLATSLRATLGRHETFHEPAHKCLEFSPDAFGAYSALVTRYPSLGDQRFGANAGPRAMSSHPLLRLSQAEGLPAGLRQSLPSDESQLDAFVEGLESSRLDPPSPPFSSVPAFLAKLLRRLDAGADHPLEPSWGGLATLLEEEQFVMAANYCRSITNATEGSLEDEVDRLEKLVHPHRFTAYVASYREGKRVSQDRLAALMDGLTFPEPRHNMTPMFRRAMKLPRRGGEPNAARQASRAAMWSADYRLASLAENYIWGAELAGSRLTNEERGIFYEDYQTVSPHAPQWLRGVLWRAKNPSSRQLSEWAELAGRDAVTARLLAGHYWRRNQREKATDWYHTAYDLEPGTISVKDLAAAYRKRGYRDEWLATLTRHLEETEVRGLEHASIQMFIARTYMDEDRDYAAALPYAEAAAMTHSASSLLTAFEAAEGLAEWRLADEYARAASRGYPSSRGEFWYFFRRRHGFGDAAEALPEVQRAFEVDSRNRKAWDKTCFPYLEGDLESAFEAFRQVGVDNNTVYWHLMAAIIALELDDDDRLAREVKRFVEISNWRLKKEDPPFHRNIARCAELLTTREMAFSREQLLEGLGYMQPDYRRDYHFFFGAILHHLGIEDDLSCELLEKAVSTPAFHHPSGHLAGYLLAKKRGFTREKPLNPPAAQGAKPKKPKAEKPASEQGEES